MVTDGAGESCPPRAIGRAVVRARAKVDGLPAAFTFHDLRHYLASLLIASGADIKTVGPGEAAAR
jgi:integrase